MHSKLFFNISQKEVNGKCEFIWCFSSFSNIDFRNMSEVEEIYKLSLNTIRLIFFELNKKKLK
jgi:hypothetical protein